MYLIEDNIHAATQTVMITSQSTKSNSEGKKHKRNIISLQTIIKQEEESIRDFTRRFGQAVLQVEDYGIEAVLQNFRRSFGPSTPFFHSLSLDPPKTMEELYRWAGMYSTLEDNIHAATQTVMITSQPTKSNSEGKKPFEPKEG